MRAVAPSGAPASPHRRNLRLLHVVRMVIRADSDPARKALFANLMQAHLWVRFALRLHGYVRGTWASAFLIGSYGLLAFLSVAPPRNRRARVIAIA